MSDLQYQVDTLEGELRHLAQRLADERRDAETMSEDHRRRLADVELETSRVVSLAQRMEANLVETDERVLNLESAVNEQRSDTEKLERRVTRFEEMDQETTSARVDVNRRLDLIEADVIDRAEKTHRWIEILTERIAKIVTDVRSNAIDGRLEAVEEVVDKTSDYFASRIDELAARCGLPRTVFGKVKLSVDRGEEAGS